MVVPAIDTPRTDFAASFTQNGHQLADFTQSSIPSPSKERNDLVQGLRRHRGLEQRTPRSRSVFAERNNLANGKPEFTPLLKSATRNRSAFAGKENLAINGHKPTTPAGFRESYRSDLPDLPEHSSVLFEDDTASEQGKSATPQLPHSSSSVVATPVPALESKGRNGLGEAQYGNLREQEARVEQLDKENFGLKLKIHYLEEAYRKSGKEFHDGLVKQLTDLQVDKVTLQRDLKHYRRQLSQTQKELDNKRKTGDASVDAELQRLQQALSDREEEVRRLQHSADTAEDCRREAEKLRDEVGDLEHELRQKDQELDEKDEQTEELQRSSASSQQVEDLKAQLEEREDDIKGLQDALRSASADHDRKLREKDRALELKDDEVRDLEEELKSASREESFAAKSREIDGHQAAIDRLRQQLESSAAKAKQELADLSSQLEQAERRAASESRQREGDVDKRDREIRTLEQKLSNVEGRSEAAEKLQDQISDLESDLQQKERSLEEREDLVDDLRSKIRQIESDSDEELMAAQDRIQELEVEQERNLKDLQALRDAENKGDASRSQALESAQARIEELESASSQARETERHLQKETHRLRDDVKHLENELDEKESAAKDNTSTWDRQRRTLEADRARANEKVKSLESAISQLRESEGTLSGKEMALQKMLEDGRNQHESDSSAMRKQIDEATAERDQLKSSLQKTTAQLRDAESQGSSASQGVRTLQDKIHSLEDEIDVMQTTHDEEASRSEDELAAVRSEAESLRRQLSGLRQDLAKAQSNHAAAKAALVDLQYSNKRHTPSPKTTPPAARQMRQRVQQLESDMQAAAKLEAELKEVDDERRALQQRLEEAEARQRASPDDAATLVDSASPCRSPSRQRTSESELSSLRSQLVSLHQERTQLEDDLDLLTSDLEVATSARDAALTTVRDLRKQLADATRAADHKYHSQVAEYERDIANLEDELSSARAAQREHEIKADSANATVARLRKRLEGAENDLATSRARERTSSESPETGRRERRELQDAIRRAERKVDDLQAQLSDRDAEVLSTQSRYSDLQSQLQTLQRDRRAALARAQNLQSELASLRASSIDDIALQKLQNRHAAELRGLAKQIEYLSAKCSRAERLRQDAAFAKGYVAKVVEVYARVHKMDLRLVREMGVHVPIEGEQVVSTPKKLGGGVDATPRSVRKRPVQEEVVARRREKRPSLRQVAYVVRAAVRIKKRQEHWAECRRNHEKVLGKWRALKEERRAGKV